MFMNDAGELFCEDDPNRRAVFIRRGFDANDVTPQSQRTVRRSANAGIFELYLQFGLQFRAVIQINQRAVQAEIADHRLFFKGLTAIGQACHPSA